MINDIIEEMRAKRSERLPMTLSHEEMLEVLSALESKAEGVAEEPPIEEVKVPKPKRSKASKKTAKKGK